MSVMDAKLYGFVDDQPVYQYTLSNGELEAQIITYGATLTSLRVPDRYGRMRDVVLGHASLEDYLTRTGRWGAVIGRVANRIEYGRFTLNSRVYHTGCNSGAHCLHGGHKGFDKQIWKANRLGEDSVVLTYCSRDGEEGFPGTLQVSVTYSLTQDGGLSISYTGVSDADTIVNLTNHAYFNLNGTDHPAEGMKLWIHADKITPVDERMIPSNTYRSVTNTLFDFRTPRPVTADLNAEPVLSQRGYYDDNFVLKGSGMRSVAQLTCESSGITMEVMTDQPGMQLFTGNPLGIALETQHFPNAVNCPKYPSIILLQGEEYRTTTVYRFSTQR